ncbi:MAG: MotA/TolQ/ExbB proton channel family protein [Planctomycetes bacterium]|nr:MotA/TolQ/ExbB proton channel family protein [Planctomycetota bacterium]
MLPHLGAGADRLESAASERMLQEGLRIERFEAALLVAAAVAPLLGLLGTVTGMISTFDVITVHGTGDPKLLAGGISEALITTQLGLSVAIPALLAGNLLTSWGEALRAGMERAALRVTLLTLPPPPTPSRPVRTTSSRLPVPEEPELVGAGEPAA